MGALSGSAGGRGRPYRSPRRTPQGTFQHRVGWLLRVNRLYGPEARWQREAGFAADFQGGCWREHTSVYRISRWETAKVRVPHLAVRRYEELLQVPAHQLTVLIDAISRYFAASPGDAPMLQRPRRDESAAVDRIAELLESVQSDDVVTGAQWDELTALLAGTGPVMLPRSRWAHIAERLLAEMIVSHGVAWAQRYEALNRLLGHPLGQQSAVAACSSLAADRTNQVFIETVSVLDASPHPDAAAHVLKQLAQPTNGRAQYGALLACVRKLRFGHFSEPQVRQLVPIVNDFATNPTHYEDARLLAAELIRRIPADLPSDLRRRLREAAFHNDVAARGSLPESSPKRVLAEGIANSTVARMASHVPRFLDTLLPDLIEEMLFSPVFDVRLNAALLPFGTPYRAPLAASLAIEVVNQVRGGETGVARTLIEALRILGSDKERALVEQLTLAPGLPPQLVLAAASTLGHLGGSSSDHYWTTAINQHARHWHRSGGRTSASVLDALIYGLGISRNMTILRRIRDRIDVPPPARTAAGWWLNLPISVYESANR
ncbi:MULTISPECIES: hypothetical protein [unclassified Micromonospora]|uniref:hypothetical protein n=1 Tax=unclassified Micromonospora TaxID=2617518 RepID=UPI00188E1A69|nr:MULTISPECIES: hypothetical protein [unclassified Micromonospora]MBF5032429.1 hypothetical protein [Micromonospora sp. ANENR4]MCZ7478633.1 hypothetical protein [Micromonospora sp. WMMC273]WBC03316.1 hypothetical protein O7546_30250 [Micromonospora sp. WMMA1976]